MRDLVVRLAYVLQNSRRYARVKSAFKAILTDPAHPYNKYINFAILFFIFTSVSILIYDVKNPLPSFLHFYDIYFVTAVFLVEYLLRLWVYSDMHRIIISEYEKASFLGRAFSLTQAAAKIIKNKWSYISSPMAIIDLFAILPAYRPLRILRVFILFRLFKALRYTKSINQFFDVLASKKVEFYTLSILLSFIVFTGGTSIYIFEQGVNEDIDTLFDGIYWALVTISTVGFGDIVPVTTPGKAASMVLIISGIGMISFATSLIVSAFNEKMSQIKDSRVVNENNKEDGFVLICGYGQMADVLITTLQAKNIAYVVIEKERETYERGLHKKLNIIHEDATQHTGLNRFELERVKAILAITADDVTNIYITLNAKSVGARCSVISRANNDRMGHKMLLAGATHIIRPYDIAGMMSSVFLDQPIAFEAINAILKGKKNAQLEQIHITNEVSLCNKAKGDDLVSPPVNLVHGFIA